MKLSHKELEDLSYALGSAAHVAPTPEIAERYRALESKIADYLEAGPGVFRAVLALSTQRVYLAANTREEANRAAAVLAASFRHEESAVIECELDGSLDPEDGRVWEAVLGADGLVRVGNGRCTYEEKTIVPPAPPTQPMEEP